jgi:pimeloyl-ACP methyl ester carboxylesterase
LDRAKRFHPSTFDIRYSIFCGSLFSNSALNLEPRTLNLEPCPHEQIDGIGHSIPAEAPENFQKLVLEIFDSDE